MIVEVGLTYPARGMHFRYHDLGIAIHDIEVIDILTYSTA